jgi:hypothetical protein
MKAPAPAPGQTQARLSDRVQSASNRCCRAALPSPPARRCNSPHLHLRIPAARRCVAPPHRKLRRLVQRAPPQRRQLRQYHSLRRHPRVGASWEGLQAIARRVARNGDEPPRRAHRRGGGGAVAAGAAAAASCDCAGAAAGGSLLSRAPGCRPAAAAAHPTDIVGGGAAAAAAVAATATAAGCRLWLLLAYLLLPQPPGWARRQYKQACHTTGVAAAGVSQAPGCKSQQLPEQHQKRAARTPYASAPCNS